MDFHDLSALAQSVSLFVRERITTSIAPITSRLDQIEQRIREMAREPGEAGPPGKDGKDADPDRVRSIVREFVEEAVASLPAPKDGEPGRDGKPGESIVGPPGEKGESIVGPPGKDGASIVTGEGPPLFNGKSGDVYIDAKTGDLYRFA